MHEQYGNDVQFYFVYCREAHAIDSDWPNGRSTVEQPVTTEERREVAKTFLEDMDFTLPSLLDDISDTASNAYVSLPDRLYLIGKDGKVAFAGDKGPFGFKPDLLENAILIETGKKKASEPASKPSGNSSRSSDSRGRVRGSRMMQMLPVMKALDSNSDGRISAEELGRSVESLKSLDKDGDGKLTQEELRPARPSRR